MDVPVLQVAQLAGMPDSILARAQEKGAELEAKIEVIFAPVLICLRPE